MKSKSSAVFKWQCVIARAFPVVLAISLGAVRACVLADNADNIVLNGGFEQDEDADGMADHWQFAGDDGVLAQWDCDVGFRGNFSQRLSCTRFESRSSASHVMLCQMNTLRLQRGKWYRISFVARCRQIGRGVVHMAISGIFFEWAGAPRKVLVTQAAMANLLVPPIKTLGRLPSPDHVSAYGFQTSGRVVIVAWSDEHTQRADVPSSKGWWVYDLQGNELDTVSFRITTRPACPVLRATTLTDLPW